MKVAGIDTHMEWRQGRERHSTGGENTKKKEPEAEEQRERTAGAEEIAKRREEW